MEFRKDIEGLRGVAVLCVLFAHAGWPGLSGGFVGVDVFFVISGFLITGLLMREMERDGGIDWWGFYAKRVRRLLPALAVMLLVVALFCMAVLPKQLQHVQAGSGLWASGWVSNLYFTIIRAGYFDTSSQQDVFLHTWSLGVEEQFYLVWPFLLLGFFRFKCLRKGVLLTAGVSLAFCLWVQPASGEAAYFLMPSRLWQLASGGLVWILVSPRKLSRFVASTAGILGMTGIGASVVLIDSSTQYPSGWALLPTASAALLLVSDGPVRSFLSSSIMGWFGRISYSLYLWHWPVLVVGTFLAADRVTPILVAGLVLLSVLLAAMSERWVERPTRHRSIADSRNLVKIGVLVALTMMALMSVWKLLTRELPQSEASSAPTTVAEAVRSLVSLPAIYGVPGCDDYYQSDRLVACVSHDPGRKASRDVVLMGDSIGLQWEPAIRKIAEERGWKLTVLTKSACPMVDRPVVNIRIKRRFTECETWRRRALEHIRGSKVDLVILGSAGTYDFSSEQWTEGSLRVLRAIQAESRSLVVIEPTPTLPFQALSCVSQRGSLVEGRIRVDGCTAPLPAAEHAVARESIQRATDSADRARLVRFNDLVCPESTCHAYRDGMLVYRDTMHLNAGFVESLSLQVGERIDEAVSTWSPDRP